MPRATAKVSKAVGKSVKVSAKKVAPVKSAAAVKSATALKSAAASKKAAPSAPAPRRKPVAKLVSVPAPAANEDIKVETAAVATAPVELTVEPVIEPVAMPAEVEAFQEEDVVATKPAVAKAKKNEPTRVNLPARLQINNLDGLYAELSQLMTQKKEHVIFDAGDISLVDSAGVQLLVAFFRSFQAGGGKVEWDNYSVQMYQMADELGISGQLGG